MKAKKLEKTLINIGISLGLVILLLIWSAIPLFFLAIFNIDYQKLSSIEKIIYMGFCDISFLILICVIYKNKLLKDFKNYFNENWKNNIKESLKYWGYGLLIMLISNSIIAIITNGKLTTNEETVRELITITPLFMIFETVIYAPISEELVFRNSIKNITNNKYIYPLLSGFIFGGLHVISSLNSPIDLLYLIPYCALGITFACLYQKTDNIFSSITAHSIHNTLAITLFLITK